jgi:short-subunit dehydrogenase
MRTAILGATRGLGRELAKIASLHTQVTGFARKTQALEELRKELGPNFTPVAADFAKPEGQTKTLNALLDDPAFNKIFYVAAGGPYGAFHEREWKDHEWAWEVSFKFPARLLYTLAKTGAQPQVILIGSSVAESAADPKAAAYASAKHALKGLQQTLKAENVRLFSPGYMDTEMLPKNAPIRAQGVYDPKTIAQELWNWSLKEMDASSHKTYPRHP